MTRSTARTARPAARATSAPDDAEPRPAGRPVPAFPVRLLALDIDGTLVGHALTLPDRTARAIRAAVRRGVHVSLATGRMATSAQAFADELGLTGPIVAYQGALIRDMPAANAAPRPGGRRVGRLRYHRPLAPDVARDAIRWSLAHGLEPHVNHLERIVIPDWSPHVDDYSRFLGARAHTVADLEAYVERPVTKVISVADAPAPMRLLPEARRAFAGRAAPTVSHPRFLEFVAPGVSKGAALARLARSLGVPLAQTMAIGDNMNDLEMIEVAGHGVAMPSAPPDVRAAARYLAPPLELEGAAEIIEALVLAEPHRAEATARRLAAEADAARAGTEAFLAAIG